MNLNNNYIYSILSNINWKFHLIFTYPYSSQRSNTNEAIKLRENKFYNFISRISSFSKIRRNKQIFTFSDEYSDSESGHIHALYKLPDIYQGSDQEFIEKAKEVWPAALGISRELAKGTNSLGISKIGPESYHNKVTYLAEKISKTDSFKFLSPEATRIIKRCNSRHENSPRI